MPDKRADVISINELAKSVEKAVVLAQKRHDLRPEPGNLAIGWEIFGRRLRDFQDFDRAFAFASDVTREVRVAGFKAEPACLRLGRDIIFGFIERGRLPKLLG
jgi:hypothetical protein